MHAVDDRTAGDATADDAALTPLPPGHRPVFLYDPDCGFCVACVRAARRFVPGDIDFAAYTRVRHRDVGLSAARCRERAWIVHPDGRVAGGAAAVAGVLAAGPTWARVAAGLMCRPPVDAVAEHVYQWVADHRPLLSSVLRPLLARV